MDIAVAEDDHKIIHSSDPFEVAPQKLSDMKRGEERHDPGFGPSKGFTDIIDLSSELESEEVSQYDPSHKDSSRACPFSTPLGPQRCGGN